MKTDATILAAIDFSIYFRRDAEYKTTMVVRLHPGQSRRLSNCTQEFQVPTEADSFFLSDVSTETYSNSDNLGSSNARVSERDLNTASRVIFMDRVEVAG